MKKYVLFILIAVLTGCTEGDSANEAAEEAPPQESEQMGSETEEPVEMGGSGESAVAETETEAEVETDMSTEMEKAKALGLEIQVEEEGDGAEAEPGQTAIVHYTGWLYDETMPQNKGDKFDSSRDRGEPFEFPLGAGRVIKGWDVGVAGMKIGGRRTLIIPAELGYGERGTPGGPIPPNATLVFDVELLDLK